MQVTQYIESRQVEADFSAYLLAFPRPPLEQLIEVLQPSANALRGLLQLAEGIARAGGQSVAQVLQDPELQQVLALETVPRKERLKRYRQALEYRRYPEVARVKRQLDEAVDQVLRDCRVRLELPKELEGDALSITLTARSTAELRTQAERLAAAAAHPATQRIYAILQGDYE